MYRDARASLKIYAGGIYYILFRSPGLPMGGAIRIAIFIGTALSISNNILLSH